ncbi:glutathione S-transferase [Hypoxylon sp. FL0543]|nr:glutathione S-transferase [Hypoxylon sp. FL0543]
MPRPIRVVLVLEERQVPYEIKSSRFEYVKKKPSINLKPNGRVPAMLNYLVEYTLKERHQCGQWRLYFGQAGWFTVLHHEKLPSAIERCQNEVRRINGVLDHPTWKKAVDTRAKLMDEQGLTWNGMPKNINTVL